MNRLIRIAFAPALVLSLSATSSAQIVWPPILPRRLPPVIPAVPDGPGPSVLVGTVGQDRFSDNIGNDVDVQRDAPASPDRKHDILNTLDGDDMDTMYGGLEDVFWGDPKDWVFILRPWYQPGDAIIWFGTYEEYLRVRALLRYVQDQSYLCYMESGGDGENPCGYWADVVTSLAAAIPTVPEETEVVVFADYCNLGPYEEGEVPETPANFLEWLPFEEADPCEATAELKMTYDEYKAAALGVLGLLDELSQAACE